MSHLDATGDLLAVARSALRERIMPRLDGEGRYEAAMVVNAMAIAIRERELGDALRRAETRQLAAFLEADRPLGELRRTLCTRIRAGTAADGPPLRRMLEEFARARLAISNPDYGSSREG